MLASFDDDGVKRTFNKGVLKHERKIKGSTRGIDVADEEYS